MKKNVKYNPVAHDLRTSKYRKRVMRDKTKYNRKSVKSFIGE